ncbi:MAG: hypothetical protein LBJ16_00170 [Holosporaceae bacterium]|jgi:drug/metabolite transporter (DMT)-like permease|nr:hypothetical protein [Holosporaceae bacterium]
MRYINFFLILMQVVLNSMAQVLIKTGVRMVNFQLPPGQLCLAVISNLYIFSGTAIMVSALALWIYLLSQYDLSFLYPLSSLAFIVTTIAGWLFFSETISITRATGIFLILAGVIFIAKS